ncbi:dipeptide epimerase [Niabella terrae]
MKLNYFPFNLKFRHPFTISKGTKTHQPTLIVELEHFGLKGYGEAPAITYYDITVDAMISDLEAKKTMIEKFAFTEPDRYWHFLHHLLPQNPFLVCALDMAAWDIFGKISRKPLYAIWKLDTARSPVTDYTIGIDSVDKMVAKLKEKPWPVYKVKLGTAEDIRIIEALRAETSAVIRVDANAGWDLETAMRLLPRLEELGVELIEQPLARDNWEGMKSLYAASRIPLIADESCVSEQDVARCEGHFHGINIKLTKCSGITPALRMVKDARKRGLQLMFGSMNESTVGSAALAHLAPYADYMDMDGPLLQQEDVATGLDFDQGRIVYSADPGLGIRFTGLYER